MRDRRNARSFEYRMADESLLSSFISKSVFAASIRERVSKTRGMKKEGGKDTADVLAFNLGNL